MRKEDLTTCHERIKPHIHRTPVLTSQSLNAIAECSIFFKCENFQKMGAFKMRGALNAIMESPKENLIKGVVTHSSGNFAQAVSLASKILSVKAYIVMPSDAPKVKINAVKGYGGEVILCEPTIESREQTAQQVAKEKGASLLHPSNDLSVIVGQGTSAMELLEEQPNLNYILTPIGGGGLVAGTALAAHFFGKNCKTIGVEPKIVDDAFRSLKSGKIESNTRIDTIADGLRSNLGDVNFPIIRKYIDRIIVVEEEEIIDAMKLIWERMKLVVEPSAAVAFAGLLKEKDLFRSKKVGIIISGGNVDVTKLPF